MVTVARLAPQQSMLNYFFGTSTSPSNIYHADFAWIIMWVICIFNKCSWNFFSPRVAMFKIQFHFLLSYLTSCLWATGFFMAFQCNVRKLRLFTVYFPFIFLISVAILHGSHLLHLFQHKNALILILSNGINWLETNLHFMSPEFPRIPFILMAFFQNFNMNIK